MPYYYRRFGKSFAIAWGLILAISVAAWTVASAGRSSKTFNTKSPTAERSSIVTSGSMPAIPTPVPLPSGTPALLRDLTQYENGGTISTGISDMSRQTALTQMRSFVLRKWGERRPGYLALIWTTPAGQPATTRFYVERNAGGTWRVMLESQGRASEEFYVVEEIGVTVDGRPLVDPRPGDPAATSRALHLKPHANAKRGLVL